MEVIVECVTITEDLTLYSAVLGLRPKIEGTGTEAKESQERHRREIFCRCLAELLYKLQFLISFVSHCTCVLELKSQIEVKNLFRVIKSI